MRKLFRVGLCAVAVHGVAFASRAIAYAQDDSLPPLPVPTGETPAAVPSGAAPAEAHVAPRSSPATAVVSSSADPEPPAAEPATRWYGYQTLGMDLLSGVIIATSIAAQSSGAFGVGAAMYAFGGPVVQAIHHRGYVPWLDLGIRVTAPIIGLFLGVIVTGLAGGAPGCPDNGGDTVSLCSALWGAAVGLGVGAGAAVALDAAVFSREKVPEPASASRTSPGPFEFSFAPTITMNRDDRRNPRPIVGIAGTF